MRTVRAAQELVDELGGFRLERAVQVLVAASRFSVISSSHLDVTDLFDPDSGSYNPPNLGSAERGQTRRASEEAADVAKTRSSSLSGAPGAGTTMAKD